jgi:head-tail adaptor
MTIRAGNLRHYVNVMQPTDAEGTRGEREGMDKTVRQGVPCSIETLSGAEGERARGTYGDVTYKVTMRADRLRPITAAMYLTGGTLGNRKLYIAFKNDIDQMGYQLELLCGELVSG